MTTILVTGASGFVGRRFVKRWGNDYHLLLPSHSELDICNEASVSAYFHTHRPDVVLHLAALSNTGYCEQHPDESFEVNVLGTQRLAENAAKCAAKFIFFSSDQIYNGNWEEGPLSEDMPVAPENHYGKHKLEAEQRMLQANAEAVALRATWMYDADNPEFPPHADFATNFARAIAEGTPLRFATREYRGITWVAEVVENLPHTFSLPGGVYNFGAENHLNTYQTACRYFKMLQCRLPLSEIVLADTERFPEHIRNISISNQKITQASAGAIRFSNTLEGLKEMLANSALSLRK